MKISSIVNEQILGICIFFFTIKCIRNKLVSDFSTVHSLDKIVYLYKNDHAMEALEFITKIKDNQIPVPKRIQSALEINKDKEVRVIVLIEDDETPEKDEIESLIKDSVQGQFLKGYADSDSIYDNL